MSHKILIIDNDEVFAKKLAAFLVVLATGIIGRVDVLMPIYTPYAAIQAACSDPNSYDLVILDVNLDVPQTTGLDILTYFKRYKSAWMVAVLTGIEGDTSADKTFGRVKAREIRTNLRSLAMKRFFPERLTVVEKTADDDTLKLRIEQMLRLYEHINTLRYVFRPIFVGTASPPQKYWQIRYDCSDLITVEDKAGFSTLWHLLKGGTFKLSQIAILDPKKKRGTPGAKAKGVSKREKCKAPPTPPTQEVMLKLARDYAHRQGATNIDADAMFTALAEVQRKLLEVGRILLFEEDALPDNRKLPPDEQAQLDALYNELGEELSALGPFQAEKLRKKLTDEENSDPTVHDRVMGRAAASFDIPPCVPKVTEAETDRTPEKLAGEVNRNRKRLYRALFKKLGLGQFADHLFRHLVPVRGKGWTYDGGYTWVTD